MAPQASLASFAAVILLLAPAVAAQGLNPNDYTCPAGYKTINRQYISQEFFPFVECVIDPCNENVCGAGNTCITLLHPPVRGPSPSSSSLSYYYHDCTCQPPTSKVDPFGGSDTFCYVPNTDVCNPNPCQNGGTCSPVKDSSGASTAYTCQCPPGSYDQDTLGYVGKLCEIPYPPRAGYPQAVPKAQPSQGVCGSGDASSFPIRCYFNNDPQGRYVCCDAAGCNGFVQPENLFPTCKANGYAPPGFGLAPTPPPPSVPKGDQGVCGSGPALSDFPVRCYYNSDPLHRYVCCDASGCDAFNADNLIPHCKGNGYFLPDGGIGQAPSPPAPPPPSPSQGVCGSGSAANFPVRCYYNNDPQGRYVCCDSAGCDGSLADNLFPHCKNNGYVPPGI